MANKQSDRQLIASKFPEASRLFGLTFSLGKTEVLFQPASGYTALRPGDQPGKDPSLFFNLLLAPPLFGLTLSLGKTGVLFRPASSSAALLNSITVDRTELKTVDDFKELGSALSKDGFLDRKITSGICTLPSHTLRRPSVGILNQHNLRQSTKLKSVQGICSHRPATLVYGCETPLELFHTQFGQRVLERTESTSTVLTAQLR